MKHAFFLGFFTLAAVAWAAPDSDWAAQEASLKAHFPDGLVDGAGKPVALETLKGKVVGLYFSAGWCGPCRMFSPLLFKHRELHKDDFQVVFVSSDRSESAQRDYMKKNKMNCPTVKFGSRAKSMLSAKYSVRGIPKLVLLDSRGKLFSTDGRSVIMNKTDMGKIRSGEIKATAAAKSSAPARAPLRRILTKTDPGGEKMSQADVLKSHFGDSLVDAEGKKVSLDTLAGKVVGVYFSAAWCGPCRVFSPKLFAHRNAHAENFQVVFVSSDRSESAQQDYMKKNKMNCPTLKFGSADKNSLATKYGVRSIPSLVILDHHGNMFSRDGRSLIESKIDMGKIVAGSIRLEKEEYLCGKCDKIHTRNKIVYADGARDDGAKTN